MNHSTGMRCGIDQTDVELSMVKRVPQPDWVAKEPIEEAALRMTEQPSQVFAFGKTSDHKLVSYNIL